MDAEENFLKDVKDTLAEEFKINERKLIEVQALLATNYINVFHYDPENEVIEYEFGWANKYDNGRPSVWTRAVFDPIISYPSTADAYRALLEHVRAVRRIIDERENRSNG